MFTFHETTFGILGEAIIDLLPTKKGNLKPHPGGSPYNVARALGKQGMPVSYLSPLSSDHLGDLLERQLRDDGASVVEGFRVPKPTSLAVVQLDPAGIPSYSLYRQGIADREYTAEAVLQQSPDALKLFHTGSLAVIPEDLPRVIDIVKGLKQRGVLISVDFNFRPGVEKNHAEYVRGLEALVPYCDVLKASDEDLELMGYDRSFDELASAFLARMQDGIVAFTLGERGAHLYTQRNHVEFEGYGVEQVVDTVGAGDNFQAGMLSALQQKYALDKARICSAPPTDLDQVLHWACACAAINVTRQGCNPPSDEAIRSFLALRNMPAIPAG